MTGEEKEELFQEALSSANVLSRRLERILKALNALKLQTDVIALREDERK